VRVATFGMSACGLIANPANDTGGIGLQTNFSCRNSCFSAIIDEVSDRTWRVPTVEAGTQRESLPNAESEQARSRLSAGGLPGEGPLRIDISKVPGNATRREKVVRVLWSLFQLPFARWTPKYLSPLRVVLLRLFGAKLSANVEIGAGVRVWIPWNLTMGEYSSLGFGTEVYNFAPVVIGQHVVVSQYNYIVTSTHDHTHPYFPMISTPVQIGSQAWIASGCMIYPGVTIGEGAVIGARSLVTKSMPAWMVCAGSPCRPLSERVVQPVENFSTQI
jgi:putative colanic acid biosynthesis acetyltransferase WcaF